VIKISLPYIYRLAGGLDPLGSIQPGTTIQDNLYVLLSARLAIDAFLNNSVFASALRSCRETGIQLLDTLNNLILTQNPSTIQLQPFQPILIGEPKNFRVHHLFTRKSCPRVICNVLLGFGAPQASSFTPFGKLGAHPT